MAHQKSMIQLICETTRPDIRENFYTLCENKGLIHDPEAVLALVQTDEHLELRKLDEPKLGAIFVDFIHGTLAHRRKFGGGRGEAIAKAVGIKKGELPSIIDATAGLGRDAFVLAALGCPVRLVERHPVVWLLLQDGLQRAYLDEELGEFLKQHLQLLPVHHIKELDPSTDSADVVYLDPMFPHKQKSALVKKEMRVFQHLVGADLDADELLDPALNLAKSRVVVKRPDYAPYINAQRPTVSRETKNHRFDIYVTK
ncbi:DNA polymerase I [Actinobacillus delphinicola]|uniref:Ribosomal RNA small subunit methyltransferase J n=1 Tax=Actinobacillus delphinicola TaxID=51161 RepID=A0A448TUA6_9PAST|nr:class I SAM-dependent methyltransferase [Actinobacillus delphinicola]MDG6897692.1 DNA polymerase I [Actinobacillus delphinicola]VEJ09574.1 Ribosomal RNA small subunit methyltransferase J [Actinobacillus delphinicola]